MICCHVDQDVYSNFINILHSHIAIFDKGNCALTSEVGGQKPWFAAISLREGNGLRE